MDHAASLRNTIVAWIGLDWADQKHDICLQARGSAAIKHLVVEHQPEALHSWVADCVTSSRRAPSPSPWNNRGARCFMR